MNESTRICPRCRKLNRGSEKKCSSCGGRFAGVGAWLSRPFVEAHSATRFLLGLCLFDFALLVVMNGSLPLGLFGPRAGRAAVLGAGGLSGSLAILEPWRLYSATFVHLSLIHLGMNLFALLSFGHSFERRFGGARLIIVYAVTGIAGFLLSSYLYDWAGPLTAGASSALFGLIGTEVGFLLARRDPAVKEVFFQYLFMAVALALLMPVNNFAHLGGFVAGVASGMFLSGESRSLAKERVVGGIVIVVVSGALLSLLLSWLPLFLLRK